jgi:N-acetylmuramoyl-L-alanine amidase CwlA
LSSCSFSSPFSSSYSYSYPYSKQKKNMSTCLLVYSAELQFYDCVSGLKTRNMRRRNMKLKAKVQSWYIIMNRISLRISSDFLTAQLYFTFKSNIIIVDEKSWKCT